MGKDTKIEWATHTVNFFIGCTKVKGSPACDNCYAQALNKRFKWVDGWGKGHDRKRGNCDRLHRQATAWDRAAAKDGIRPKVFANSLSDFFDPEVDDAWRVWAVALITMTPNLDWLILTKRAKEMHEFMVHRLREHTDFIPNLFLGVTAENQETANERIPLLLDTPAAKRFVSMEPLLGPVDLRAIYREGKEDLNALTGFDYDQGLCETTGLDWVITGGESGSKARPSHPDWFRAIRDDCAAAGVPFLFKQWGEWEPSFIDTPGHYIVREKDGAFAPGYSWEVGGFNLAAMSRVGKKTAGRLLDGKQHDGRPE